MTAAGAAQRVHIPSSLQRRRYRLTCHAVSAVLGRDFRHVFAAGGAETAGRRLQSRLHHFQRARNHGPGRAGQPETDGVHVITSTQVAQHVASRKPTGTVFSNGSVQLVIAATTAIIIIYTEQRIVTLRIRDG